MATVNAIKYGMKGDDVSKLQTTLKNAGYNIDVDGSFGPQTLAAVKEYQKSNGLTVDGMVGPQTQAALYGGSSTSGKGNTLGLDLTNGNTTSPTTLEMKSGDTGEKVLFGNSSSPTTTGGSNTNINYPDMPTYEKFVADEYGESPTVQAAYAAIEAVNAAKPGAYESKWADQVNGIIDKILNRESFSYDYNSDPLYKMYAEQYQRLGKLAMEDTMGQAAALTGGYGNSYASTAGNQAYQAYLSQLNDVIPELYGMALDRYNMEGQELYNQYGMLSAQEQQEYGRYMDGYNQWLAERDYATGRYDTERGFDYGKHIDDRNLDYQTHTDEQDRLWNEYVTGVQQTQWGAEWDASEDQRRIDNDRADKELGMKEESWNIEKSAIDDSTKSYSGNGFNNGSLTNGQIKELQSVLGVEADGKFGPKSKEAAGGLSADEAYAKYVGGTSTTSTFKGLTASEAKGVASQIAEYADNEDLEGAEAYLTYLVANEYITEEEAKSFLAPYVNVEEDEVVDTTVDTYTGSNTNTVVNTNTGSNSIPPLTLGADYPILISLEQAGAFANSTLTPEELMKLWKVQGQFTGLTPEKWAKTLVGAKK